jgi:hypothetical protein
MTTIILFGFLIVVVCAAQRGPKRNKPVWAEHLEGWQKVFGLAALILAFLIMMNPEFLALGLVGDATFFDLLVLTLSLQLRSVVFSVGHSLRVTYSKIWSFAICGVRRDFAMLVFTLASLGRTALTISKAMIKSFRQHEHTFA